MGPVFLLGGGWQAEAYPNTYGRFIDASKQGNQRKFVLVIVVEADQNPEEANHKYRQVLNSLGVKESEIITTYVSDTQPLAKEYLAETQPTGILICGGLTPLYYQALCLDTKWLEYIRSQQIPFAGFSAGAAIAADHAILGGWKISLNDQDIAVLDDELAEGLDYLDIREGLGLVPFSVDVHASQWGTITRLIHAVDQGHATEGWAIDEDTMLQVKNQKVTVHGLGQAYYVQSAEPGKVNVKILRAGDFFQLKLTSSK